MTIRHFEFLVEEQSMEAFLRQILPKIIGDAATFEVYAYQGKHDLMSRLDERLRGYARWLPPDWCLIVIVDKDDDDCNRLKSELCDEARTSGLILPNSSDRWQLAFRIAIEELEAWYFGEWRAVRSSYPRAKENVIKKIAYRNCDQIAGGTWEAFEREMQKANYFAGGLRKVEAARSIGANFVPEVCQSESFKQLKSAIEQALTRNHRRSDTPD